MIAILRIIALFLAFSLLAACGLKGPLYLPKDEPAEDQAATEEAPEKPAQPDGKDSKADGADGKAAPASEGKPDTAKPKAPASRPSDDTPALEEPPSVK